MKHFKISPFSNWIACASAHQLAKENINIRGPHFNGQSEIDNSKNKEISLPYDECTMPSKLWRDLAIQLYGNDVSRSTNQWTLEGYFRVLWANVAIYDELFIAKLHINQSDACIMKTVPSRHLYRKYLWSWRCSAVRQINIMEERKKNRLVFHTSQQ